MGGYTNVTYLTKCCTALSIHSHFFPGSVLVRLQMRRDERERRGKHGGSRSAHLLNILFHLQVQEAAVFSPERKKRGVLR